MNQDLLASAPPGILDLPRDSRGYPIPWFVAQVEGQPVDLRIAAKEKRSIGWRDNLCWVCGVPLGRLRVFVGGPLAVANQVFSDWCCHERCAQWSAIACPVLNGVMKQRSGREMPEDAQTSAGHTDLLPTVYGLAYASGKIQFEQRAGLFVPARVTKVCWVKAGWPLTTHEALAMLREYLAPHGFDEHDIRATFQGNRYDPT